MADEAIKSSSLDQFLVIEPGFAAIVYGYMAYMKA